MIGDFEIFDLFISIALMGGVIFLLIKYGLKVYKVGILNYSSGGLWKKMLKALDRHGVNSHTLFPDLEGLCKSLNWRNNGA